MGKIRVLVVDDAVVMRRMISEVLGRDPEIEVVGVAANGSIALQKLTQVNPDLITMDVEMPELDGVETVRALRRTHPRLPVIMFSTLTARGALTTLDALAAGASDYVTKPANVGSVTEGMSRLESELIPKIKAHCQRYRGTAGLVSAPVRPVATAIPSVKRPLPPPVPPGPRPPTQVVCIGTSTGGPNALAELLKGPRRPWPVPTLVVQHMPPVFTAMLAERLARVSGLPVHEGQEGQLVEVGHVYLAPGGHHMEVRRDGANVRLRLQDGPPENSCRPAVDVLFRSVAAVYGNQALGVVMTGMGQDGMRGCEALRERGCRVLIQDEPSSVVWGMPGAVAQAGLADVVLPLASLDHEITQRLEASSSSAKKI